MGPLHPAIPGLSSQGELGGWGGGGEVVCAQMCVLLAQCQGIAESLQSSVSLCKCVCQLPFISSKY